MIYHVQYISIYIHIQYGLLWHHNTSKSGCYQQLATSTSKINPNRSKQRAAGRFDLGSFFCTKVPDGWNPKNYCILQGTITLTHLRNRKIIDSKVPLKGDMFISRRIITMCFSVTKSSSSHTWLSVFNKLPKLSSTMPSKSPKSHLGIMGMIRMIFTIRGYKPFHISSCFRGNFITVSIRFGSQKSWFQPNHFWWMSPWWDLVPTGSTGLVCLPTLIP